MNPLHYPSLELCKKLTEFGFPETAINYEQLKTDEESDFTIGYTAKSSAYNIYRCPSVMELLDFIRKKDISLNYTGTINFLSLELPDALSELILIYLQNNE